MAGSAEAGISPETGDVIAPERQQHMPHFRAIFGGGDVIDAEFEDVVVVDEKDKQAPASAKRAAPALPRGASFATSEGRKAFARRMTHAQDEPRERAWRGLFPAGVLALCALSFWVFGGHAVLAHLVAGGGAAPLRISDISTNIGIIDGMRVAMVNGRVSNISKTRFTVPALDVRAGPGGRSVTVQATAQALGAGESTGFRARLPIGEGAAPKVTAAFLTDAVAD